jgi:hypothetical protein
MSCGAVVSSFSNGGCTKKLACLVLFCDPLHESHDFETGGGVQTAGRLVQEQDFGRSYEVASHAYTTLLAATDALVNGSSD